MNENFELSENMVEDKTKPDFDKTKLILPGSILIAAVLISSSLLYVNYVKFSTAQIGGNNPPQNTQINIDDSPYLGNKNAKITIVEFADFRCPFCGRFFQDSEKQIITNYVNTGKAKFVFKHYAFLGQESVWAGEAAECAKEQGKFWEYHDWLFNNQASESDLVYYSKVNLIKYADKIGLNTSQFSLCLNSDKYSEQVKADLRQGQSAGVTGTPTVFINGKVVIGAQPFSVFKSIIDGE